MALIPRVGIVSGSIIYPYHVYNIIDGLDGTTAYSIVIKGDLLQGAAASTDGSTSHAQGTGSVASGPYSHAEGNSTNATNSYSHAEGTNTYATGPYSHTEGNNTTASNNGAHAEGHTSTASGEYSHAEGDNTTASNEAAHSEGTDTQATGKYSHAEGDNTIASGQSSHAEGETTTAYGSSSHAEGAVTQTYGKWSHAEGYGTITVGTASHAEGYYTIASGSYQNIVGKFNKHNNTTDLFVIGGGTNDNNRKDIFAVSTSNISISASVNVSGSLSLNGGSLSGTSSWALNAITASYIDAGNITTGTLSNNRLPSQINITGISASLLGTASWATNVVNLTATGSNTEIQFNKNGVLGSSPYFTYDYTNQSLKQGENTIVLGEKSHAEGNTAITGIKGFYADQISSSGIITISASYGDVTSYLADVGFGIVLNDTNYDNWIGKDTAKILYGNFDGFNTFITTSYIGYTGGPLLVASPRHPNSGDIILSNGIYSHAEGYNTNAAGDYSHAEGYNSMASNDGAHAEGSLTSALGFYSHAEGQSAQSLGSYSHAEGSATIASGSYSHAEGYNTEASGIGSHAEGQETKATQDASHAEGYGTIAANNYSHAEGINTVAYGEGSHAGGFETIASGSNQTVVGTYNVHNNTTDLFVIGGGDYATGRKDVFNVSSTRTLISGSTSITGSLNVIKGITGSLFGTSSWAYSSSQALTASYAPNYILNSASSSFAQSNQTGSFVVTSSFNSFTSSINSFTSSVNISLGTFTTTSSFGLFTSSINSFTSSTNDILNSINSKTGSYATTGSNTFNGNEIISGSLVITQNLTVLGSSSITYVTASQLALSASYISVNVFEPLQRFGGIYVYDSGSSQATASLTWDSLNNNWVYTNASGSDYTGGMLLSGPRNTGSLGQEVGLTNTRIPKSIGKDHLDDSIISDISGSIYVSGSAIITGSLNFLNGGITGSLFGTSSWASQSITASYINANNITTGTLPVDRLSGTYNITSSWADNASKINVSSTNDSSDYAVILSPTATGVKDLYLDSNFKFNPLGNILKINGGTLIITGSTGDNLVVIGSSLFSGSINTSGSISASAFTGSLVGIASTASYVSANNIAGTIPSGILSGTYSITSSWAQSSSQAFTASYIDAANITIGTLPSGRLSGNYNITSSWANSASNAFTASYVDAANITTGTLSSGILSGNYSITSSWAQSSSQAFTSSYISPSFFIGTNAANSSSFATTASYIPTLRASGLDTQIQFNSGNILNGSQYFTYNYNNQSLQNGIDTSTSGSYSHAEGNYTTAYGFYSHAEGDTTKTGTANAYYVTNISGSYRLTLSSSYGNVAGYFVKDSLILFNDPSTGIYSTYIVSQSYGSGSGTIWTVVETTTSVGSSTVAHIIPLDLSYNNGYNWGGDKLITASAVNSHTEGFSTITLGPSSHAEGYTSVTVGSYSHAEGKFTQAIGFGSHAEGNYTQAVGSFSHAEGDHTIALNDLSHAEGYYTTAYGPYSHVEGVYTIASGSGQTVVGQYNKRGNSTDVFVVGGGSADADASRKDVFAISTSSIAISGSINISGSLITNNVILGTSSWAQSASNSLNSEKLNNQAASYYLNASNINAGTIGNSYLPLQITVTGVTASLNGNVKGTADTASYVNGTIFTSTNQATSASYAISASSTISANTASNADNIKSTQVNNNANYGFVGITVSATGYKSISNTDPALLSFNPGAGRINVTSVTASLQGNVTGTADTASIAIAGAITGSNTFVGNQTFSSSAAIIASGSIVLANASAQQIYNGEIVRFGTGTLTAGQLYYLSSTGAWTSANANAVGTSTGMLGIATGTSPTTNGLLVRGFVSGSTSTATGSIVYAATSSGLMTTSVPTTSGHVVRVMGYVTSIPNTIYFDPDRSWITLA